MAKRQGKKASSGSRNDGRNCGKAWKKGLHPDIRNAQEQAKREAKKARKAAKAAQVA